MSKVKIIHTLIELMTVAELAFGKKTGEQKKQYVLLKIKTHFDPSDELLELYSEIIDVLISMDRNEIIIHKVFKKSFLKFC